MTRHRDSIYHRLGVRAVSTAVLGERKALRQQHRILEDTIRLYQLQIDNTVAGRLRIEQHDRIHYTIGAVSGISADLRILLPNITCTLAIGVAESDRLRLAGSTQRIQMQIIFQ